MYRSLDLALRFVALAFALSLLAPVAARAGDDPDELCSDRPGLDTPPCVVGAGTVQIELGLADWSIDSTSASRTDDVTIGDTLLRYGVAANAELRAEWQAFGTERVRARDTGLVSRDSGVGDVTLSAKVNLSGDGKGPIAVLPYVTLPTGTGPLGSGTWQAGLLVPVSVDASKTLSVMVTPQIAAAADQDGEGRHLAWGSSAGIGLKLSDAISGSLEAQLIRDEDPAGATTQALAGAFLAWQPGQDSQIDIGVQMALNAQTPDTELYVGLTRRF